MPILDIDDKNRVGESRPPDVPRRLYRTNEELGTSTLFSKNQQLDTIMQYISGMKWTVDYFLQLRNRNEDLVGLDPSLPATIQKYHRISKLIIILQSGIEQNNVNDIEGEAIINAGFLPNKFDCFLATLTGGREAIFQITDVDLRKYSLHDTYWVRFKLLIFVDNDNNKLYNNLIYKTVKEYIYDKNHIVDYSAPIILQADYNRKLRLKERYKELVDYYFDHFIHPVKRVLAPPTKSSIYTDTLLTEFIFNVINQEDSDQIYKLTRLDDSKVDGVRFTIWDSIINRDPSLLKRCEKNIGFKYVPYDITSIRARQFNYLGVSFLANKLGQDEEGIIPEYENLSTYKDYFGDTVIQFDTEDASSKYDKAIIKHEEENPIERIPDAIVFDNTSAESLMGRGAILYDDEAAYPVEETEEINSEDLVYVEDYVKNDKEEIEITKAELIDKIKDAMNKLSYRLPIRPDEIIDAKLLNNKDVEVKNMNNFSLVLSPELLKVDFSRYVLRTDRKVLDEKVEAKDLKLNIEPNSVPMIKIPLKKEKKEEVKEKIEPTPKVEKKEELKIEPISNPPTPPVEVKKDGYVKPILYPDQCYVLSKYFYNQDLKKLGIVEENLIEYLHGRIINLESLEKMLEQYHMWCTKDQYYLIPILIVLVKDSINNIFKSL